MPQNERELIQRLQRGEEAAYEQLVADFGDELYGLAAAMLRDRTAAADVTQETFLGAYRGIGSFRGASSLRTWLTGILMRQAWKAQRTRRRDPVALDRLEDRAGSSSATAAADARMDVQRMLEALSPEHHEVIVLRELQGLSYDEIVDVLGVPRGTVESRIFRARQRLMELFRDQPRRERAGDGL